jgi:hypothetical protein
LSKHSQQQKKTTQMVKEKPEKPWHFAFELIGHSFWAMITFIFLLSFAGGIEVFSRLLVRLNVFDADSQVIWIGHAAAVVIAGMDFTYLVAVVGKKLWARYRKS